MLSPSDIKEYLSLLTKFIKFAKEYKVTHILNMGLTIVVFYMCFTEFYLRNRRADDARMQNKILPELGAIAKQCGIDSFVSWISVEEDKFGSNSDNVTFIDVIGCLGSREEHCPVSVKFANKEYLKIQKLGLDDKMYLGRLPTGMVINCSLNDGDMYCPEYTPLLLRKMVKLANLPLDSVSYVVVKDFKQDLIYIFSLSFVDSSKKTCSQQIGNSLLARITHLIPNL